MTGPLSSMLGLRVIFLVLGCVFFTYLPLKEEPKLLYALLLSMVPILELGIVELPLLYLKQCGYAITNYINIPIKLKLCVTQSH